MKYWFMNLITSGNIIHPLNPFEFYVKSFPKSVKRKLAKSKSMIKPFDEFPVPIEDGFSVAMLFGDALAEALFIRGLEGAVITGPTAPKDYPRIFSIGELLRVLEQLKDRTVFVRSYPLLRGSPDDLFSVLETAYERNLTIILTNTPLALNELNLLKEFERYFFKPEIFDYLMVLRTKLSRGKTRGELSVIRVPPQQIELLGEHSFQIKRKLKSLAEKGQ